MIAESQDVVVVGSINQDYLIEVGKRPLPGETITGATLSLQPGGKGANQAVAAGRLGAKVKMIGAVGDDIIGQRLLEAMSASGVNIDSVRSSNAATGSAFAIITPDGENSIVVASGANWDLNIDDIVRAKQAISSSKVLVVQMELRPEVVEMSIDQAGEHTFVILNLAPVGLLSPEALKRVNLLVVNEHEASFLAQRDKVDTSNASQVATKLLGLGIDNVIITLGSNGAVMVGEQAIQLGAPVVSVVDTTGAGDAFVGALAARISAGCTKQQALQEAIKAASFSVQFLGAQSSFPDLGQIIIDV